MEVEADSLTMSFKGQEIRECRVGRDESIAFGQSGGEEDDSDNKGRAEDEEMAAKTGCWGGVETGPKWSGGIGSVKEHIQGKSWNLGRE